ncbi:MAG: hypothetical protein ACRDU4_19095, partial [Mycobacterium sp.]
LTPVVDTGERNGARPSESSPVSFLPRRNPGSSGITDAPAGPTDKVDRLPRREPPPPRREEPVEMAPEPPAAQPISDTSSFFGSRARVTRDTFGDNEDRATDRTKAGQSDRQPSAPEPAAPPRAPEPAAQPNAQEPDDGWPAEAAAPSNDEPETDLIYQRMLSEWLVDPHELAHSADLDWKSVWDRGWSAAAEAENVPVQAHTDQGLPVREPGARLVPGAATPEAPPNGIGHHRADENSEVASNGGFHSGRKPAHEAPTRDPDAIRASISSHFGGVRAGRSHARETDQGPDAE